MLVLGCYQLINVGWLSVDYSLSWIHLNGILGLRCLSKVERLTQFPSFSFDGANVRPFAMLLVQRECLFT